MRRPPEPVVALASILRWSHTPKVLGALIAIDGTVGLVGPMISVDWLYASDEDVSADSTPSRRWR